jgi:hypothetical protein
MPLRLLLLIALVSLVAVPTMAADDLIYDVHLTGNVSDMSLDMGDFVLRDRQTDYLIIADSADVQLMRGNYGTLMDIKDGAVVRVFGERLSSRTVYAKVIIVLENSGRFVDTLNTPTYGAGDSVEIDGVVTHVSIGANTIDFHSRGGSYTINPRLDTIITRGVYRTDIYGIFRGDRIRVSGRILASGLIDADTVRILDSWPYDAADGFWSARIDVIVGVIVTLPSRPSWAFTVRTPQGIRSVRLAIPNGDRRTTQTTNVDDLKAGATVQLTGVWDAKTLVANRFVVSKTANKDGKSDANGASDKTKTAPPKADEPKAEH